MLLPVCLHHLVQCCTGWWQRENYFAIRLSGMSSTGNHLERSTWGAGDGLGEGKKNTHCYKL